MALSPTEKKARRVEGMKRAKEELTTAQKIQRALINGRPPASELKTPLAAVTAARVLYRELESRIHAAGLDPKPGNFAVAVAYISPDLTVLAVSRVYQPGREDALLKMLDGHIMLGLVFGILDENDAVVVGARPFLVTKQTDGWLSELASAFDVEVIDPA